MQHIFLKNTHSTSFLLKVEELYNYILSQKYKRGCYCGLPTFYVNDILKLLNERPISIDKKCYDFGFELYNRNGCILVYEPILDKEVNKLWQIVSTR